MSEHVEVVGQSGSYSIVSRETVLDRTIREAAQWPTDEASQRMWCVMIVTGQSRLTLLDDSTAAVAERLRTYITYGAGSPTTDEGAG